jgi:hypothetical protein
MFRESNSNGAVSERHDIESVLRHPDGSINFDAYRAAARGARQAAIVSSIEGTTRAASAMLTSIGTALTGKSAKHQAHHTR